MKAPLLIVACSGEKVGLERVLIFDVSNLGQAGLEAPLCKDGEAPDGVNNEYAIYI